MRYKEETPETSVCFGELYPEKTFYIIRRSPDIRPGLFSNFHYVLGHILYALENNYIPVVDMQNYKTNFNEDEPVNGTKNAWEYYFEQPTPYTLEQAYKGKNVILSGMHWLFDRVPFFLETEEQITRFNDVISKYMKFNAATLEVIDKSKLQLFAGKENILGVQYRGTDYIGFRPKNHSIMVSVDDYIHKTHECFEKWGMNWIYLMTEDTRVVKMFEKEFSNKLILLDRKRIDNYNPQMGITASIRFGRCQYDNYYKGLEYIQDTVLLSYCDALIAPKVNGSMAALALNNNKYKHKYIFSVGKF